jgi:hypothetical protein
MIVLGYAVKTLESKETRASKEIRVTHNSVFAAHRLQCRMTIHKVDIRHFVCSTGILPLALYDLILDNLRFGLCLCTFRFESKNFNAVFPMYSCSLARFTPGASMQASG